MSQVPAELRYLKSHEWLRTESDGSVTVGITDHAQDLLGDLVFVELPEVGRELDVGEECCVLESVKAASDVYSPARGEVVAVNESLADSPELINQAPYGDGWLFKLKLAAEDNGTDALLNAEQYQQVLADEAH